MMQASYWAWGFGHEGLRFELPPPVRVRSAACDAPGPSGDVERTEEHIQEVRDFEEHCE